MSFADDVHEREPSPPPAVTEPPIEGWAAFSDALHARLVAGRRAYGERSLERSPAELLGELQQEALDLAGWGYVLWQRIERLQRELEARERRP